MALDRGFDRLDSVVGLVAELSVAAATDEVVVLAASATNASEEEPASALGAAERAAQVVVMAPASLSALALGVEEILHLVERGLVDQGLMAPLVVAAVVVKSADVIVVSENRVESVRAENLGGRAAARARAQAAGLEDRGEVYQGVLASCVEVEGKLDQRSALRIDGDRSDFAAVEELARVQVTERRTEGSTARLRLLRCALDDLGSEIAAVELGDRTHDPVQQEPRWRLVDVLGDGDELRSRASDLHDDSDVIGPVSGQPIDLVHDYVCDVALLEPFQQSLQSGPVRGLGRLAPVDILLNDL